MASEIKDGILVAWNKYMTEHQRRLRKNEGSTTQYDDTVRLFKEGIINHNKLSKTEKEELLQRISTHRQVQQN